MIYQETYQYLVKYASSKEIDVCLVSLLKTDWDGLLRVSASEIAKAAGTTAKYVKEIFAKWLNPAKKRFVLSAVSTPEGEFYRFNLGKSNVDFCEKTDRYCKKYSFFYTNAFRALPVAAKRLLLIGAFEMSVQKSHHVSVNVETIVPGSRGDAFLAYTKKRLHAAIDAINKSGLAVVSANLSCNVYTRKEEVRFSFADGMLACFESNHTERFWLRQTIIAAGSRFFPSDDHCIELEKTGKYVYQSLIKAEKQAAKRNLLAGTRDAVRQTARLLYRTALTHLAPALNENKELQQNPKAASAYFSTIIHALASKELANMAHQSAGLASLIERMPSVFPGEACPMAEKKFFYERMQTILQEWCEQWIVARVKKMANRESGKKAAKEAEHLEKTASRHFHSAIDLLKARHLTDKKAQCVHALETVQANVRMLFLIWMDPDRQTA